MKPFAIKKIERKCICLSETCLMEPACRPSVKNLSIPLRVQMKKIELLNIFHRWGIPESAFKADIPDSIPCADNEIPLVSVYFPNKDGISGVQRTFDCLWDAVKPPSRFYNGAQNGYIATHQACD
jgi:hypothetical protein